MQLPFISFFFFFFMIAFEGNWPKSNHVAKAARDQGDCGHSIYVSITVSATIVDISVHNI